MVQPLDLPNLISSCQVLHFRSFMICHIISISHFYTLNHIDIFLTHFNHSNRTGSTSFHFKHPLVRHPLWRLDHHWHRSQYLPGRFPGDSSDCATPWPASQRHDRVERYVVRCHQNLHPREIREVKPWERKETKKKYHPLPFIAHNFLPLSNTYLL